MRLVVQPRQVVIEEELAFQFLARDRDIGFFTAIELAQIVAQGLRGLFRRLHRRPLRGDAFQNDRLAGETDIVIECGAIDIFDRMDRLSHARTSAGEGHALAIYAS